MNYFEEVRKDIWERQKKQSVLIAAHRGTNGGNIVQNTLNACLNAYLHGADIVEVDIIMSTDGDFFTFHNGQEPLVLSTDRDIRTMSTGEIEDCRLHNSLRHQINQKVNRLDDVLEALKGKGMINIDRSWFYWSETIKALKRHQMFDQIIIKSPVKKELLEIMELEGGNLMYMPIVENQRDMTMVMAHKLNVIAAEVILPTAEAAAGCRGFLEDLHRNKILAWINAIKLDDRNVLSGGYDDDMAILEGCDRGWGRLLDMGFDIIQTDWPMLLRNYVKDRIKTTGQEGII